MDREPAEARPVWRAKDDLLQSAPGIGPAVSRLPQFRAGLKTCVGGIAQTTHNGSILVGLCDGSVRGVSSGGVQASWFPASTPDGGEVLGNW